MDGVLNMHGPEWKAHTRALAAIFQPAHVSKYLETMHHAAVMHSKAWLLGIAAEDNLLPGDAEKRVASSSVSPSLSGGGADLLEAVRGILMFVLMKWAYGLDLSAMSTASADEKELARDLAFELANYGRIVGKLGQKPLQLACNYASLVTCTNKLRKLTEQVIELKKAKKARGENAGASIDAISRMLDAGSLSVNEIAGEVNHIHGAHKAAGYVLTHLLHDLSQLSGYESHANISEMSGRWWAKAARKEALSVLGQDGIPTREDLANDRLPIIKALVLEAQRKHVVSLGVVRRTGEPLTIDGITIPSGTEVVILLQALHHVPAFWPRPFEFRPERWLKKNELHAALLKSGFATAGAGEDAFVCSLGGLESEKITLSLDSSLVGSGLRNQPSAASSSEYAPDPDADTSSSAEASSDVFSTRQQTAAATPTDASLPSSSGYSPEPYAFIPFLSGARMCAGKALAELELTVCLAAILRNCEVKVELQYCGHVNGVPKAAAPAVAKRFTEQALAASSSSYRFNDSYKGPADILLNDNMYSSIDGTVPFVARKVGE
jgi:cytochrome P450